MSTPLIRFARRLSSWDPETSDDDLLETEFWDRHGGRADLRPSVYEIVPGNLIRAFAEHATAFHPPASAGAFDLGGTGRPLEDTPGDTGFSFTMEAHREIVLRDRDDLLALVREVRASLPARAYAVTRAQVIEYARTRLVERDPEWESAQAQDSAQKWLKKIAV